ncbi:MAG: uracil-DNA glycosylase family protein [Chitinispirillaceae bacterium]
MQISKTLQTATLIRDYLSTFNDLPQNPIDKGLLPVPPFKIGNDIKLIIIGQDPTIRNVKRREFIDTTLNLDKNGSLKTYISDICAQFSIELSNIYATNVFKYFYQKPPADTKEVLKQHLAPNLQLLRMELEAYPDAAVFTLGEPVLQLLIRDGVKEKVRMYWDYEKETGESGFDFTHCRAGDNAINRDFFPFPHQPSIRKEFYKSTFGQYLEYMRAL